MRCAVKDCKSSNNKNHRKIGLFVFPTNPDIQKKWISFCRREETFDPSKSRICGLHFTPEDVENRVQYEMGFARHQVLRKGVVPTVDTNTIGNDEQNTSRIEKQENKKIVESLLEAYEAEEKAKLHEEPEANIDEYVDPDNLYVSDMLTVKIEPDLKIMDEDALANAIDAMEHSGDFAHLVKTTATQTDIMDDEYACALVTVSRNFLTYHVKCFYCDACYSINYWDELMGHIESEHRSKIESQVGAVDESLNQNLILKTVDETAGCLEFEENDIKNVSVLDSYPIDAYKQIDEYSNIRTEQISRKRKRGLIYKCHNLDFSMETSDALVVFYLIDLLHSIPTLWFIDDFKAKQYKIGLKNLYTKIHERYDFKNRKELHKCLIKMRDWYQEIFKQKISDQLSYPQSEYYCKLAKFLPESLNEKTCECCGRTFEDHLQYFSHKKLDHAENDNEDAEDKSLEYLKENLTDYFHSRYRHNPPGQSYECRVCFQKYVRRNALIQHVRTHLDIRSHVCHICGKTFVQKHTYAAHKRRHYGLRRWKCLICGKAFTTCTERTIHRKRYHIPIEGTIEEIEKNIKMRRTIFTKPRSKVYKSYTDGDQKRYACLHCDEKFARYTGANRHYDEVHRSEMDANEVTKKAAKSLTEILDETDDIKFEVSLSEYLE